MRLYVCSVFILFTLHFVKCRPLSSDELVTYLSKYGYTVEENIKDLSTKAIEKAIKVFQKNFLLPVTGKVNNETEVMMSRPRCGRKDEPFANATSSIPTKWPNTTITYKFISFPKNGLSKSTTLKEIAKSFDIWAEEVPLTFQNKDEGDVDIEITFMAAKDGDGPGNTLAYAYYPTRGDVFFDAENWTMNSSEGVNLFLIAAHEIGHSLGLSHSGYKDALMSPFAIPYDPNFKLHYDDVTRIQKLYGSKTVDAAFLTKSNELYLISGDECMKYRNKQLQAGYPKKLTEEWPGLPSSIDAAYYFKKNIYFFKDSRAWVYNGTMRRYECEVLDRKFDAAFTVGHRLYLFSESQYWRYNYRDGNVEIMSGSPKQISSFWKGIPSFIDAAYYDEDQYIYFFKDNLVYTFDTENKDTEATSQTFSDWINMK